jgi:hypothetical protein
MRNLTLCFALCLAGCAYVPPGQAFIDGVTVTLHEGDTSPCLPSSDACSVKALRNVNVYFRSGDTQALAHELEHAFGGLESEGGSVRVNGYFCEMITAAGSTRWRSGRYLCRASDGTFFQM